MGAGQPYKTLVVNLCFRFEEFESAFSKYTEKDSSDLIFLDCMGVLEDKEQYNKNFHKLYLYDEDFRFRKKAVERFVEYTSNLSDFKFNNGKHVRSFTINKLPVYWVTDISEKHPLHHILFNVFYLDELLDKITKKVKTQRIVFILPSDRFFYRESLMSYFQKKYSELRFEAISTGIYIPSIRQAVSFVKQNLSEHTAFLRKFKANQFKIGSSNDKNIILTFLNATWIKGKRIDFVMEGIRKVNSGKGTYVPLIYNWSDIFTWDEEWDGRYLKAMPGKAKWFGFLSEYFLTLRTIHRIENNNDLIKEGPVSAYALKMEMLHALANKFYVFKNYIWLKSYFKKLQDCNVFYQDEFYNFGRVISQAVMISGKNRSVGFQHGMIREDHTVYALTEVELNGQNPMPSPESFVAWGNYFKSLISKRAGSYKSKIIVAANPNLFNSNAGNKKRAGKVSECVILWCTGILSELIEEFELIGEILLSNKEIKVVIRMHPIHDLRNELTKRLNAIGFSNYVFSNNSELREDILNSDILLSTSASTVILEGLALERHVIAISLGRYLSLDIQSDMFKEVGSKEDLVSALKNNLLSLEKSSSKFPEDLLSRDVEKWKEILSNE